LSICIHVWIIIIRCIAIYYHAVRYNVIASIGIPWISIFNYHTQRYHMQSSHHNQPYLKHRTELSVCESRHPTSVDLSGDIS
jgi:hypothetical protein